ncbi:unnamed protein product [Coccothraustes coccothraustes]
MEGASREHRGLRDCSSARPWNQFQSHHFCPSCKEDLEESRRLTGASREKLKARSRSSERGPAAASLERARLRPQARAGRVGLRAAGAVAVGAARRGRSGPARAGAAQRSCPGRHRGCPWARQLCRQGPGAVPAVPDCRGCGTVPPRLRSPQPGPLGCFFFLTLLRRL